MAATKNKSTPYQPVFPTQYPQECKLCKTPDVCEKFVVKGSKADTCIFFCPKNPGKTSDGKPLYLGKVKEVQNKKSKEIMKNLRIPTREKLKSAHIYLGNRRKVNEKNSVIPNGYCFGR